MKTLMYVVAAFAWTVAVFLGVFWLTFPSATLAERLRYEVPRALGDAYSADVGSVSPWWIGVAVHDVKLFKTARPTSRPVSRPISSDDDPDAEDDGSADAAPEADAEGPQLVALLSRARIRVSPWSLLRRAPYVSGSVTLTEGTVGYAIGTAVDDRGQIGLADLELDAAALPLDDVLSLLPVTASGTGSVDLSVDLHAGESGMRDASGTISLTSNGLALGKDLELPGIGAIGMEIPLSGLVLTADVEAGKATINEGRIDSELLTATITGDVTLRDPLDRSAIDLTITLSKLGPALSSYEMFLSDAKTSDGTYQYTCRGVISRLSQYSCTSGSRDRRTSRTPSPSSRSTTSPIVGGDRAPETDADRERRREELRERLRQRREERDAERPGAVEPPQMDEGEGEGEPVDPTDEDPEELPPEFELEEPPNE